jgi:hypothetical protein
MLRSWWCCCVASSGSRLGRHSHSPALLGQTPSALLSPHACSLHIYLAVYYLYRLQMLRSSLCPPATNRYARLFFPLLLYETLEVGEARDEGL